jgi:hypothetical protein
MAVPDSKAAREAALAPRQRRTRIDFIDLFNFMDFSDMKLRLVSSAFRNEARCGAAIQQPIAKARRIYGAVIAGRLRNHYEMMTMQAKWLNVGGKDDAARHCDCVFWCSCRRALGF